MHAYANTHAVITRIRTCLHTRRHMHLRTYPGADARRKTQTSLHGRVQTQTHTRSKHKTCIPWHRATGSLVRHKYTGIAVHPSARCFLMHILRVLTHAFTGICFYAYTLMHLWLHLRASRPTNYIDLRIHAYVHAYTHACTHECLRAY